MLASILIIAFSFILLVYWFRYTCLLLLRNSQTQANPILAQDEQLSFKQVQDRLDSTDAASLDPLHHALNRDYAILTYLLQHAAALSLNPIERHLLTADYRVMGLLYRLTRSRRALREMASIIRFFAERMGEHALQTGA